MSDLNLEPNGIVQGENDGNSKSTLFSLMDEIKGREDLVIIDMRVDHDGMGQQSVTIDLASTECQGSGSKLHEVMLGVGNGFPNAKRIRSDGYQIAVSQIIIEGEIDLTQDLGEELLQVSEHTGVYPKVRGELQAGKQVITVSLYRYAEDLYESPGFFEAAAQGYKRLEKRSQSDVE